MHGVHPEPKSTTFKGHIEYLDELTNKYQELLDADADMVNHQDGLEQMKHAVQAQQRAQKVEKARQENKEHLAD